MKDGGSKMKHCVCLILWRMDEELPKKEKTLCVSLVLWKMDKKLPKKDKTLCVSLC